MSFTVIDWIFSIIIVAFAVTALAKGFIESIFNKLSWILGIIAAIFLYKSVAINILKSVQNPLLANVLGFILVFVVVFIIVKLVQTVMERIFQFQILKSLDRVLGFAFGIIEGAAVVVLLIFLLDAQPFFNTQNLFNGSFYYALVSSMFMNKRGLRHNV